jgi:hypothetical protein
MKSDELYIEINAWKLVEWDDNMEHSNNDGTQYNDEQLKKLFSTW